MDLWWLGSRPTLAGMLDGLLPNLFVAAITGGCAVAAVLWLAKKRWEPALHHLTTMVDREMQGAERAAQALQQRAQVQAQRGHRQAASVHGAIAGVRALQNLTEELDQCANDLNHLAQLMAQDTHRSSTPGIARHVVSSAKQLSMTAEQARITYRRLQSSVNQLLAESTNDEVLGEEMAQHAHELTGAVQRLRQDMHGVKTPTRRPHDPREAVADLRHEEPLPRRDPRDEPPPRRDPRDEPISVRREMRDERPRATPPPRDDRRYDEPRYAEVPRERPRGRDDDAYPYDERRERDLPLRRDERHRDAPRPSNDNREDDPASSMRRGGNAGPTRRRESPPDVAPRRLPDLAERPNRRDIDSGWLSDQYPLPRRHDDDQRHRY